MNENDILGFAKVFKTTNEILAKHKLVGWNVKFNSNKHRLGLCDYRNRTIEFSSDYIRLNHQNNWDSVLNTIKHEIAHAMVFDRAPAHIREHHGQVWKMMALIVGATPRATAKNENIVSTPGAVVGKCICGKEYRRHRMPRQYQVHYCTPCYNRGEKRPINWRRE